jgi:23S rRNA (uracil1939-C5)-methyltransferase
MTGSDGTIELVLGPTAAAGGDAIGRLPDGRVVFVEDALPGERIALEVTEDRRDYARGRLVAVLDPSPARVEPPCPWVGAGCGGCGWQHAVLPAQLVMKGGVVRDALRRIARLDAAELIGPALSTPPERYRTTVHLGVDPSGRPSYRRRHRHELVPVTDCRVAHPRLAELIAAVRVPGAAGVTLRVGVAGGERLVVLEPPANGRDRRARNGQRGRRGREARPAPAVGRRGGGAPEVDGREAGSDGGAGAVGGGGRGAGSAGAGGAAGVPGPAGIVVPDDAVVIRPGEDGAFTEAVGGQRWRVSARSFFQAGPAGAEALVAAVDEAVGPLQPGDRLVDLYAGVGLLGGVVASRRRGVLLTSVESDRSALGDARHNLADLGASVVAAEVGAWPASGATVAIADPPRSGLGRPGAATVVATGCRRLVLVSCDPASLARDTSLLASGGYRLGGVRVVDLFPHTPHVETVAHFELTASG